MNKQVDIFSLGMEKDNTQCSWKKQGSFTRFLLKTLSHNYFILIPQFARWLQRTIFIPIRPLMQEDAQDHVYEMCYVNGIGRFTCWGHVSVCYHMLSHVVLWHHAMFTLGPLYSHTYSSSSFFTILDLW